MVHLVKPAPEEADAVRAAVSGVDDAFEHDDADDGPADHAKPRAVEDAMLRKPRLGDLTV